MEFEREENIINLSKIEFPLEKFINAGYKEYQPEWKMRRKGEGINTFYYILSGEFKFILDKKAYICPENTFFYLSDKEKAEIINNSKNKKASLYFITFYLKDGFNFNDYGIQRPICDTDKKFNELFKLINKTHLSEGAAYKIKEFYKLSHLLYELITYKLNTDESYKIDLRINKAIEYIKVNYYKNITVEEVSRVSGYSVSHFRRLFLKATGASPQEYILNYKLKKAKELLLDTEEERTVEEISELLGMCNPSYFCKLFKEKTGFSPHKYKRNMM